MMVVDDQGSQAGCYGDTVAQTPNLDYLAAHGTRFTHAFCTASSCSPSRSVILTGLHCHANGQYGLAHEPFYFHTRRYVKSLPVLLREAGYRTCSVGKFHLEPEEIYHFDEYPNKAIPGGFRNPRVMAQRAKEFIKQDDPRPFFLYFCTDDPHRDRISFANDRAIPGVKAIKYRPDEIVVPDWLPDLPEVRQELADYYEAISRADQGVGEIVTLLKETGHWEDTLIAYLSDNGPPFPGAKTNLYDPGTRLPLVVRVPGQQEGTVSDALVSFVDITPSVLEYAGVPPPEYTLHGQSFLPLIDNPKNSGQNEIYFSQSFHEVTMYYPMRAIRTGRYKCILNRASQLPFPFAQDLHRSETWKHFVESGKTVYGKRPIANYHHRPPHELYDLSADPNEVNNLADKPEYASLLFELETKLKSWQKETKDPWFYKYEYE